MRLFDLVMALGIAVDTVSPAVANHHLRVAYIALSLGRALGWPDAELHEVTVASALHDIGAFSLKERLDLLAFEEARRDPHAEVGYRFLKRFPPFAHVAELVRYHHLPWRNGAGSLARGAAVPPGSHLIHLADRVSVLVEPGASVLQQVPQIVARIETRRGSVFAPEHVDALLTLAGREYFWLDIVSPQLSRILDHQAGAVSLELDLDGLAELARLFSRIIDFKSPFTATHSSGVAATAEALAELAGYAPAQCKDMLIAGYLHDLGKLAVPAEVLEKAAALTADERATIRSHTYYTRRILEALPELGQITAWAADHHEHLDGRGYPYHFAAAELSPGARILAVADVFTALAEDRPYRAGMDQPAVLGIMRQMVADGKLDQQVLATLELNYPAVDAKRTAAQAAAREEYALIAQPG